MKIERHLEPFAVTTLDVPNKVGYVIDKRCKGIRKKVLSGVAFHGRLDLDLLIRSVYLQGIMDGVDVSARQDQFRGLELNGQCQGS